MRLISLAVVAVSIFSIAGCAADAEPAKTTQNQTPAVLDDGPPAPEPYDFQWEAKQQQARVGTDPIVQQANDLTKHRIVNTEAEQIVNGFTTHRNDIQPEPRF